MALGVGAARAQVCETPGFGVATAANAISSSTLAWAPFGRAETGWLIYHPRLAHDLATRCAAGTPGFAAALARWQRAATRTPTGVFDEATFAVFKSRWQSARPFVALSGRGVCPPPLAVAALETAAAPEGYAGKPVRLRRGALAAWRRMVAEARAQVPAIRAEPRAFTIFSAFRDPAADAARCVAEGNCDGTRRARCSPHRTGLALDMWVGQAPGYGPDSSADLNRLAMVATPTYRWLVANARRHGFVNYAFEPWHWEWTGEPI